MLLALIILALLCSVAGVGLLIYSEISTDPHSSFFCFCVGVGMGIVSSILLLAAIFQV
jgi:hypothetical protein